MTRRRSGARRAARTCGLATAWALSLAALAGPLDLPSAGSAMHAPLSIEDTLDRWMRRGLDEHEAALAALDSWRGDVLTTLPSVRRQWLFVRGHLEASHGLDQAATIAAELRSLVTDRGDALAGAAADLIEARSAEVSGPSGRTGELARAALEVLAPACEMPGAQVNLPGAPGPAIDSLVTAPLRPLPAGCDYRLVWRALELLAAHEQSRGAQALAAAHADAARELARRADDAWRHAESVAQLAVLSADTAPPATVSQLMRQAHQLAGQLDAPELQARIWYQESRLAELRGQRPQARAALLQALPLARQAGSSRLQALLLIGLADIHTRTGQPAQALQAVEQAMPIVERHADRRLELALLHNAALARISLGRIDEARPAIARVVELTQRGGANADAAAALREFSQAMAQAGAVTDALELYHRERGLAEEATALNRQTALEALRAANDTQRKERDIELLARDNALKAEALANHELRQRIAVLLTLAVALAGAVAGMLVWRLRETQRRLVASEAQLRVQSERDPLTQLANRRHFQAVMRQRQAANGFGGALLLVDIDHFKLVNDRHGHAAGDAVLVEVARRLNEAVRGEDLVVRWGGEEFLVLARDVPGAQLEALAQRVLQKVAQTPVAPAVEPAPSRATAGVHRLPPGPPVRVTASIGYARFPLPPHQLALSWEQALHLTDLALYRAKHQGRNRAVGVVALQATDTAGLQGIEADFDGAVDEGRVTLHLSLGPTPPQPD